MRAVADAARNASTAHPRSLTFKPVHAGPAEIAAPMKLPELDEADEDVEAKRAARRAGRASPADSTATSEYDTDPAPSPFPDVLAGAGAGGAPPGGAVPSKSLPGATRVVLADPEAGPHIVGDDLPRPYRATLDGDVTRVRLAATANMRRLPELWCTMKKAEYGLFLEMEFSQPPLGILFQGRTVKGTIASSPASVLLSPGDRIMSVNGMNLESWGKLRVQDVSGRRLCSARVCVYVCA